MDDRHRERVAELVFEASLLRGELLDDFERRLQNEPPEVAAEVRSLLPFSGPETAHSLVDEQGPERERVGPYRLEAVLGDGAVGRVFLAVHDDLPERRLALKLLKPGLDTESALRRFRNERRSLERLDHPGVVAVLDAGADERGRPYLVMELVEGPPIDEYVRQRGSDLARRIELFLQVCDAVEHAHARGVVHRDLKPANVLVADPQSGPRARVVDFGTATLIDPGSADEGSFERSAFDGSPRVIGTLEYLSPEVLRGEAACARSDVYSLGALLYVLLVGRPPHPSSVLRDLPLWEVAEHLERGGVPRPSRLRKEVPVEVDWIVLRALDPDPRRRYASARALADDLRRQLRGDRVSAAPPSRTYRTRRFLGRHRRAAALVGVITLSSAVAIGSLAAAYLRTVEARVRADAVNAELEASTDFLASLISAPGPYGLGADAGLRDLLDRSAAEMDEQLSAAPGARVRLRPVIGRAYAQLGLGEAARRQFELAAEDIRRHLPPATHQQASLEMDLANLDALEGRHGSARERALGVARMLDEAGIDSPVLALQARAAAARHLLATDPQQALTDLTALAEAARTGPIAVHREALRVELWCAEAARWCGDREGALARLDAALQRTDGLQANVRWEIEAGLLRARAATLLDLTRHEPGIAALESARDLLVEHLTPDHPGVLGIEADIAMAIFMGRDGERGLAAFADVVERRSEVDGRRDPEALAMRSNLLSMRLALRDHEQVVAESLALAEDIVEVKGRVCIDHAQVVAVRARALADGGDDENAEQAFEEALGLLVELGAEGLPIHGAVVRDLREVRERR
ncbi:MAG: serine/threonine-protein kinase [Planctomycetota bacterium]